MKTFSLFPSQEFCAEISLNRHSLVLWCKKCTVISRFLSGAVWSSSHGTDADDFQKDI